jgi:hypothetical protein
MPSDYSIWGSIKVRERNTDVDELLKYLREHNESDPKEDCYFDDETSTLHFTSGGYTTISFSFTVRELLDKVGLVAEPCVVFCRDGGEGDGIEAVGPDDATKHSAVSAHLTAEFLDHMNYGLIEPLDIQRLLDAINATTPA